MKYFLEMCLTALTLTSITPPMAAQSATVPMQRGISVRLPVTSSAVAVPNADKEGALVVAVTHDGSLYLGTNPITPSELAKQVKNDLASQTKKVVYIKADARTSYASVIKVLDAVRAAGVEGLTLLTDQRDGAATGTLVPPKGLEMLTVSAHGVR
jgi:biopolymer transport protein TolR